MRVSTTNTTGVSQATVDPAADRLLAALAVEIAEVGVRAVSLRAVARRAGLSHAAPGHCFGDLDGMLAAFAGVGFEELGERLNDAVRKTIAPLDQLKAIVVTYVEFATTHAGHFDVMFRIGLDKTNYPDLMATAAAARHTLSAPASRLAEASGGQHHADDIGLHYWALAHGFASLAIDGQLDAIYGDRSVENLLDGAIDLPPTLTDGV